MKWLFVLSISLTISVCAQHNYTADEYAIFKYIMLIGNEIWEIIKKVENKNRLIEDALRSLKAAAIKKHSYFTGYAEARKKLLELINFYNCTLIDEQLYDEASKKILMFQIEDMRESWPSFDTFAEKTFRGFFLEFEEHLSMNLWTPWGKLPIAKSYIEDKAILAYRDKIIEALSATKFVYGDKTIYTLHRIIKNGYNGIDLPIAMLTDQSLNIEADFYDKWQAMQEKWHELNPKTASSQKPIKPVPDLVNKESPRQKRENLRKTLPGYEKPVLSLMHLT